MSERPQLVTYAGGLPAYITSAIARVGLHQRKYQQTACLGALKLLRDGENAEINLPPGTGKTLISQIIGCIWIREKDAGDNKVLCLVPSTTLREQHYNYCAWWAGEASICAPIELTSRWLRSKGIHHQGALRKKNFCFALPELFYNAVARAYITPEVLDKISLVILDEYDAFSIGVLKAEGERLRFTKDWERLLDVLQLRERRYVLMSATPARHPVSEEI